MFKINKHIEIHVAFVAIQYDFCHVVDKARYGCLFYGTKSKWVQLYANWRLEDPEVLSLKCIIDSG